MHLGVVFRFCPGRLCTDFMPQILYFDHRGMGLSSTITADTVKRFAGPDPESQASYLRHFRQDSAVKDLEAIRKCLTADYPEEKKKWSFMGQSYGGFVAVSYLSKFPEGLREVFTMGGLPPIRLKGPDEVYERLVRKVEERNVAYYRKFPEDGERVRRILKYLDLWGKGVNLPSGGRLTPKRFMEIGIMFGKHGGLDAVHDIVLRAWNDLEMFDTFTRPTRTIIESQGAFDDHPIYAILHEAIYCQGGTASNWAADRVVEKSPKFNLKSVDANVYFSGEMIFKQNFEDYPQLEKLEQAAEVLAQTIDWGELYDIEQLKRNKVTVYSSTYIDYMYVDFDLAQETAGLIKGCKTFVTNAMYHDAPSKKGEELMRALFALKEDSID